MATADGAMQAAGAEPVLGRIAAALAERHGGSPRAWERILRQVRDNPAPLAGLAKEGV
ncbi:hypothetical protein [Streptomyces sp. NPDC050504]|uniref:hypothetical protein n=1 Tax=Streptomyces sp. NPDC050504 TaxID=3365618 RepID=UPI0037A13126